MDNVADLRRGVRLCAPRGCRRFLKCSHPDAHGKAPPRESEVETRHDCRLHGRITGWAIRTFLRTLYLAANRQLRRSKEKRKLRIAQASLLCHEHSLVKRATLLRRLTRAARQYTCRRRLQRRQVVFVRLHVAQQGHEMKLSILGVEAMSCIIQSPEQQKSYTPSQVANE